MCGCSEEMWHFKIILLENIKWSVLRQPVPRYAHCIRCMINVYAKRELKFLFDRNAYLLDWYVLHQYLEVCTSIIMTFTPCAVRISTELWVYIIRSFKWKVLLWYRNRLLIILIQMNVLTSQPTDLSLLGRYFYLQA